MENILKEQPMISVVILTCKRTTPIEGAAVRCMHRCSYLGAQTIYRLYERMRGENSLWS